MNPITADELFDPATLVDRSGIMPRPPRRVLGVGSCDHNRPNRHARPNGHPHHDEPGGDSCGCHQDVVLTQRAASASIHPQLPPTPMWSYEGLVPGPVLVVDSGVRVEVTHRNEIEGMMPYRHVVVDEAAGGSMNTAGTEGTSLDATDQAEAAHVAALHAHTVVHLHGAPTGPNADGLAENVVDAGEDYEVEYEFPRETWPLSAGDGTVTTYRGGAAPTFWYHDHGMSVTRFNVYAGLAGLFLVRDPIERQLGLPTNSDREIPLVLMDRGLDTIDGSASGALDGRLLHKVQVGVRECFAPVNLVNGLAWPRVTVRRAVHRLREVNGSHARTYRLHFMGLTCADEATRTDLPVGSVVQIGTDGGLLGAAVDLPAEGLVLAPGERADLLLDVELVAQAGIRHVVVYNSAPAPWGGSPLGAPNDIWTPDPDGFRPIPQVMRFDVTGAPGSTGLHGKPIRAIALDPAYRRLPTDHADMPHDHGHVVIALREEEELIRDASGQPVLDGDGLPTSMAMLFLHELQPQSVADRAGANLHDLMAEGVLLDGTLGTVPVGIRLTLPGRPEPYVTVGRRYTDTTMLEIVRGTWQLWKVINLSPDTHPFHVHLTQFQAVDREYLQTAGASASPPVAIAKGSHEFDFVSTTPGVLDDNETGWKDTIRVNPGDRDADDGVLSAEMVTILGNFSQHNGRYMYHCHILEHEDMDMMRPFVVVPAETAAFMGGHSH